MRYCHLIIIGSDVLDKYILTLCFRGARVVRVRRQVSELRFSSKEWPVPN